MRKIYTITIISSLIQALACGFLFWAAAPFLSASGSHPFWVGTALVWLLVWLCFFSIMRAIRRRIQPTLGLAVGVGSVAGVFCSLMFVCLCGVNPFADVNVCIVVGTLGAGFGVLLAIINFVVWTRIGFIRFMHESDDIIYQRVFREAAELADGQVGIWPPPPQRPDSDATRL